MNFYDDGYKSCDCFWGKEPAGLVKRAVELLTNEKNVHDLRAIDFGCGEGKNVKYIAEAGIDVVGIDLSEYAIKNARNACLNLKAIFLIADMRHVSSLDKDFDLVVSTGSIHCLPLWADVVNVIDNLKKMVANNGIIVFSTFNDRSHDFSGHPSAFNPILIPHKSYVELFSDMHILHSSDEDLIDIHPNNGIRHQHSITRIMAKRS